MRAQCSINERGQVQPCNALGQAIEYENVAGKGLRFVRLTKLDEKGDFGNGRHFVTVRSGEFVKRGIILNFCPFCGSDIGSHMKASEEGAGE